MPVQPYVRFTVLDGWSYEVDHQISKNGASRDVVYCLKEIGLKCNEQEVQYRAFVTSSAGLMVIKGKELDTVRGMRRGIKAKCFENSRFLNGGVDNFIGETLAIVFRGVVTEVTLLERPRQGTNFLKMEFGIISICTWRQISGLPCVALKLGLIPNGQDGQP